jgi:hypothetical protein
MKIRRVLAISVGLALAIPNYAMASQPAQGFGEATAAPSPRIDADALGPGYEAVAPEIEGRADALVRETDIPLARVEVHVAWVDAQTFVYAIDVTVDPADDARPAVNRRQTCRGCTTEELVVAAESALRAAIGQAHANPGAESKIDPEPSPSGAVEAAPPVEPQVDRGPAPRRRLGTMGWSGVGLLGAGTAVAVTGGVLLGLGSRDVDERPTQIRDFRPAGIALLSVGAVAVVTGAVLLGLDRRGAPAVALGPVAGPHRAGIAVYGRF